jgi:hypothetical protein
MGAGRHAVGLYRRLLDAALRPVHAVEADAHHLHEIERVGQSGETPYIAILGVFLFLVPIFCIMLGLALLAVYLVG